ncbi:hypothetical protein BS50DRAFT_663909 [Corynespora cassiicola Philippines]|uniref:Uncharacterized protein n=1 Tax=Corynespora cassiicola Philippines TaxID=1448308 RepID=A0A2T2NUG0_CORCC|nr:hypothetical protein BS50DRAFT_663909 [Corynespora cassiicola Philippines]
MGGRAFKQLYTPRISSELYLKVKAQATEALRAVFSFVIVPTELPSKRDFGDVDFLVGSPLDGHPISHLHWITLVSKVKEALGAIDGKRGFLNNNILYFAVAAPGREDEFHIQIDVKIAPNNDASDFEWDRFMHNYASGHKILGSMMKPLGLSILPEGLHIRIPEVEDTNHSGSMVFLSKDPKFVLYIAGLKNRFLNANFNTNEELYDYLCRSWLFNPTHFAERLRDKKYEDHIKDRSAAWVYFITKWIPEKYPGYRSINHAENFDHTDNINQWYKETRAKVRERAFDLKPEAATEYYKKRAAHLKQIEEERLRHLILRAIPQDKDGWRGDLPEPLTQATNPHRRDSLFASENPSEPGKLLSNNCPTSPWDDRTNYVGMWKRRLEREDMKKAKEEAKVKSEAIQDT